MILVQCNVVNNSYQPAPKVLFTFVPDKQFGQLITIVPHSLTMLKYGLQIKIRDHLK